MWLKIEGMLEIPKHHVPRPRYRYPWRSFMYASSTKPYAKKWRDSYPFDGLTSFVRLVNYSLLSTGAKCPGSPCWSFWEMIPWKDKFVYFSHWARKMTFLDATELVMVNHQSTIVLAHLFFWGWFFFWPWACPGQRGYLSQRIGQILGHWPRCSSTTSRFVQTRL